MAMCYPPQMKRAVVSDSHHGPEGTAIQEQSPHVRVYRFQQSTSSPTSAEEAETLLSPRQPDPSWCHRARDPHSETEGRGPDRDLPPGTYRVPDARSSSDPPRGQGPVLQRPPLRPRQHL